MADKITLGQITNAFTPSKVIDDAERFAGRIDYLKDSVYGLLTDGAHIAIVGGRGIGKSSLAKQIQNISQGKDEVLDRLDIELDETFDFLTIYLACGGSIKTVEDLIKRLLTTRDCLLEWIYDIPTASKELDKLKGGLDFKIANIGGETAGERASKKAIDEHDVETIFQNILSEIVKSKIAEHGILIIIDEFDQIENPSGFAKLLKSLATNVPKVKFCIVGVAQDLQNLLEEHESINRLFPDTVINLPSMSPKEMNEIFDKAEQSIDEHIKFNESARERVIELANGHPYITHLLGKQALKTAYFEPKYEIDSDFIDDTLKLIAEKEVDPVLEGRYKKAVASSYQREAVLKSLVDVLKKDGEAHTSDAYKIAIDKGVDNPSQYIGHLVTPDFGSELIKVRERYYRFKDSLFATYVNARPYLMKK